MWRWVADVGGRFLTGAVPTGAVPRYRCKKQPTPLRSVGRRSFTSCSGFAGSVDREVRLRACSVEPPGLPAKPLETVNSHWTTSFTREPCQLTPGDCSRPLACVSASRHSRPIARTSAWYRGPVRSSPPWPLSAPGFSVSVFRPRTTMRLVSPKPWAIPQESTRSRVFGSWRAWNSRHRPSKNAGISRTDCKR